MKKTLTLGIIFVMILSTLVMTGCKKQEEEVPVVEIPEEEPVVEQPQVDQLVEKETAPEEVDKCDINTVIAFTGCEKLPNGNVAIEFMNTGKGPIEGAWYYIQSFDGEYGYEKLDLPPLERGEKRKYEVDINKWSEKIGEVKQVIVKPVEEFDGEQKACNNQKKTALVKSCK